MSTTWRMAGLNYVNYSNIAAKTLRQCLKANLKEDALKRDGSHCRCHFWVDGHMLPFGQKPGGSTPAAPPK